MAEIEFETKQQPLALSTDKNKLQKVTSGKQEVQTEEEVPATTQILQISKITEEISNYQTSISDLRQDEQMFRSDQDPTVFGLSSEEDLNNNHNYSVMDLQDLLYSDDYISKPEDIEDMFPELYNEYDWDKQKEEDEENTATPEIVIPITPPPPPSPQKVIVQRIRMLAPKEQETVKLEGQEEFDLIKYIDSLDVSQLMHKKFNRLLTFSSPLSCQQVDNVTLTPTEEKSCPTFDGIVIDPQELFTDIKPEPTEQPSTSTSVAPSRRTSVTVSDSSDDDEDYQNVRPKRKVVRKRKYSSDSEYSVGTSASSFNATRQKSNRKKRGRPAKELITNLPTIEDFAGLPKERAEFLVLRIKNNEASRKSRMKSKSVQDKLEEDCTRLKYRKKLLKQKRQKLDGDIEKLRKWLLARG